jgi:hypothetical protein
MRITLSQKRSRSRIEMSIAIAGEAAYKLQRIGIAANQAAPADGWRRTLSRTALGVEPSYTEGTGVGN